MIILTVVGARPQFVKAAVVSRAFEEYNSNLAHESLGIKEIIVHTGQHYDDNMSEIFFEEMRIPKPDYYLGIGGGLHGAMTGKMLEKIEQVIVNEQPDMVLVYGDTNSTLAGALAAAKLHIPVAHVEAGLRSFNMRMPEEINRILTDRVSSWLFCPTDTAVNNLRGEGYETSRFSGQRVCQVGDVMCDAALFYKEIAEPGKIVNQLIEQIGNCFYLATVHRAENTDDLDRLRSIVEALEIIAENIPVILPLHPRTRKALQAANIDLKNILAIDPVGYFDMLFLLSNCRGVFTDSGGVQKEAYFFNKPCVTLRDETEWIELVEHGFNTLVGADAGRIMEAEERLRSSVIDYSVELYGNGNAGKKIVKTLTEKQT